MVESVQELTAERYASVDEFPEVAIARQEVRTQAWATVHLREQQMANGEETTIPLAVDAISTAEKVIEARDHYSSNSHEYQEKLAGLELDCTRLVAEWYRKKRPEYFPKSRHFFDAETGDFYSHGLSIRQMTENALRPIDNDPEEVGRRVNERVENETPQILRKLGSFALGQVGIRTISECTDKAIKDYQQDITSGEAHRGYGGYVPEIEKVMIRDMRFDEEKGDRLEEQIGLPGTYINHYVIQKALRRRGVETKDLDKTELHGTQLLVSDDLIDFVELLDTVAAKEWCVNIFMGEKVELNHSKDYSGIRQEATKRQEGLRDQAKSVALFVVELAENGVDRREAPAIVEEFVKLMLLNLAKEDVALAEQMFDNKTAVGLQQVAHLESVGRYQDAADLLQIVKEAAPGGGYCGAGSCGLEQVIKGTKDAEAIKKLGFNERDTLLDKGDRKCRDCGKKTVAYDTGKALKGCTACGATAKYK